MNTEDLQSYLRRRWDLVEALKADFWAQEKRRISAADALRIGDGLRDQARALHPDGASAYERAEDLCSHQAVAEKLRLVRPHADR